jgi:hypothetical protein
MEIDGRVNVSSYCNCCLFITKLKLACVTVTSFSTEILYHRTVDLSRQLKKLSERDKKHKVVFLIMQIFLDVEIRR